MYLTISPYCPDILAAERRAAGRTSRDAHPLERQLASQSGRRKQYLETQNSTSNRKHRRACFDAPFVEGIKHRIAGGDPNGSTGNAKPDKAVDAGSQHSAR